MLLDTSGLLCYLHVREAHHRKAVQLLNSARERLTHNYVVAEFIALSEARGIPRADAVDFMLNLGTEFLVDLVIVDQALHNDAMQLLSRRLDKRWSLCDAVSFVLMQERGLHDALTLDHHFEQAGFARLLK